MLCHANMCCAGEPIADINHRLNATAELAQLLGVLLPVVLSPKNRVPWFDGLIFHIEAISVVDYHHDECKIRTTSTVDANCFAIAGSLRGFPRFISTVPMRIHRNQTQISASNLEPRGAVEPVQCLHSSWCTSRTNSDILVGRNLE